MQISPLDGRLVSARRTVDPHWGKRHNSSADFNPNYNHVNAAPNKQASRPPHVHITMQPPSKITVIKCTRLITNLWNKKIKKSGIGHQIFKKIKNKKNL